MSMIVNHESITAIGLERFVKRENKCWICQNCVAICCVHRNFCLNCKEPGKEQ